MSGRISMDWNCMSSMTKPPLVEMTFLEALHQAIARSMRNDHRVVVLGEDIAGGAGQGNPLEGKMGGTFGVTKGLIEEFGSSRVRDTPISEAGITAASVGAAMAGLRPILDLMWASFAPNCFDQIVNQAAKLQFMSGGQVQIPLVIRMAVGGGLRAAAQHSDTLYPLFTHIPGLKVAVPATPDEAYGLLLASISDNNPVIFMEHMGLYRTSGLVNTERGPLALGEIGIIREGCDITVACIGQAVLMALEAAEILALEGIELEVISLRTLQPFDSNGLRDRVEKTRRLVVVEEGPPRCSVSTDISASIGESLFGVLLAPVARINSAPTPVPFSPPLEDAHLPSAAKIVQACRNMIGATR